MQLDQIRFRRYNALTLHFGCCDPFDLFDYFLFIVAIFLLCPFDPLKIKYSPSQLIYQDKPKGQH